jgi:hypothetical protein
LNSAFSALTNEETILMTNIQRPALADEDEFHNCVLKKETDPKEILKLEQRVKALESYFEGDGNPGALLFGETGTVVTAEEIVAYLHSDPGLLGRYGRADEVGRVQVLAEITKTIMIRANQ